MKKTDEATRIRKAIENLSPFKRKIAMAFITGESRYDLPFRIADETGMELRTARAYVTMVESFFRDNNMPLPEYFGKEVVSFLSPETLRMISNKQYEKKSKRWKI